ncbi:unnamed protein product [Orchesella dallaii]|uniref:Uncharacterized protein n=1 Tax=Orchesella dallaii TaxID=48710 RepID=A0ABP1RUP7_9HEXA
MEYLKYRARVKIVGFIDSGLMGVSCFILFISTIVLYTLSWGVSLSEIILQKLSESTRKNINGIQINSTARTLSIDGETTSFTYFYISSVIDCAVTTIQLIAAMLLINSTKLGKHAKSAYRMAAFWFAFGLVIFIAYAIWRIVDQLWLNLVLGMIYRGILLGVAWKYVCELRIHVVGASPPGWQPPNGIDK